VEESPADGSLHASLAGALGALGRYDEAIEHLGKAIALQPLNPEAFHNRAVIHERRGDIEAALEDYRTALRYNPSYEPSRSAMKRLGRSDSMAAPATPEEAQAHAIAERAGGAARRGDYQEAMRLLDEAMGIAPDYALIYQYRSNVAYLMGDVDGAIAALEKGLALQPDNALFKENLRRLGKAAP
jgi:tetratricopeptide (TPR) repeat protein